MEIKFYLKIFLIFLNDVKTKLVDSEKSKTIIHLFNSEYLLDNKKIKNLPIGLHGDFYSHQLTFFMMKNNELKDLKALFNRCNLNLNKIILKSFYRWNKNCK